MSLLEDTIIMEKFLIDIGKEIRLFNFIYKYIRNYQPYKELQEGRLEDQNIQYFNPKAFKNLDNLKIY